MNELRRHRSYALTALLAAVALGSWLLRPSPVAPDLPGPASVVEAPRSSPARTERSPQPAAPTSPANFAASVVPLRPGGAAQTNAEGLRPHDITPQHARIFRENDLIGSLNGAMDVKDAQGLRQLLSRYRDEYPEDAHVLQRGYELIADCLERPGGETRAVAQRYYDEALDSGLRRYIRRHCLETAN